MTDGKLEETLRDLIERLKDGRSYPALAEPLGVTGAALRHWADGRHEMKGYLAGGLAAQLGVDEEEVRAAAKRSREAWVRTQENRVDSPPPPRATRRRAAAVLSAIDADPNLLDEAKEHLKNQYGLLLRVSARPDSGRATQGGAVSADPGTTATGGSLQPEFGLAARRGQSRRQRQDDAEGQGP